MKYENETDAFLAGMSQLVLYVAATGLFLMTLVIGWQVFARFVLNASPAWTESTALLLMLYYVLLAAAVGVREGFHLGVRLLLDRSSGAQKQYMMRGIDVLIAVFGALMVVNGARLAAFTANHVIPTLGISRAIAYWPFVISGVLILAFCLERIVFGAPQWGRGPSSNS